MKSWTHFYRAIIAGQKKHDLRKKDRDFNVGDHIILREYDTINEKYTGAERIVRITYITDNRYPCAYSSSALSNDYCILSLELDVR